MEKIYKELDVLDNTEAQQKLINDCTLLGAKAVTFLLCDAVDKTTLVHIKGEEEIRNAIRKQLVEEIEATRECDIAASLKMQFEEQPDYILHISLSIAMSDFVPEVLIPDEKYKETLYRIYDVLKTMALTYWVLWKEKNPELHQKLINAGVPLELTIQDNHISLAFMQKENETLLSSSSSPSSPSPPNIYSHPSTTRIVVMPFYKNQKGEVYVHEKHKQIDEMK